MLKLLLSEIKYSKTSILIVTGIIILINIMLTVENIWAETLLKMNRESIMYWGLFTMYYLIFAQSRIYWNKINKKRRLALMRILPVSTTEIALFRILYFSLLWLIPVLIVTFFYSINVGQPFAYQWLRIIGFTSIIYFLYISLMLVPNDLNVISFSENKKYFSFFSNLMIYAIIFSLNYYFIAKVKFDISKPAAFINPAVRNYLLTAKGIELNLIHTALLIIFSIFTFNKRKSYL